MSEKNNRDMVGYGYNGERGATHDEDDTSQEVDSTSTRVARATLGTRSKDGGVWRRDSSNQQRPWWV